MGFIENESVKKL